MKHLKSIVIRAGFCAALAVTATATTAFAAPSGPFVPGFGPGVPDFGFGGSENCRPIGDMPDFCIPDVGPSFPNPFEDIDTSLSIPIQYSVLDVASDYGEPLNDPTLVVYAVKSDTGELYEARRRGWIVLPGPGLYTFAAESAFCSIPEKKVRVTQATRRISLKAFCE